MQYQYWRLLLKDLKSCKTLMKNDNCTQRLFLGGKKDSQLGSRELYTLITKFPHLFSTVKTVDIWTLLSLVFFMDLVQVYDWIFAQTIVCTNGVGSEWLNEWRVFRFICLFNCMCSFHLLANGDLANSKKSTLLVEDFIKVDVVLVKICHKRRKVSRSSIRGVLGGLS